MVSGGIGGAVAGGGGCMATTGRAESAGDGCFVFLAAGGEAVSDDGGLKGPTAAAFASPNVPTADTTGAGGFASEGEGCTSGGGGCTAGARGFVSMDGVAALVVDSVPAMLGSVPPGEMGLNIKSAARETATAPTAIANAMVRRRDPPRP